MRRPPRLLAMLLAVILILPTMMFPSIAAGGSYSVNWAAADPALNNKSYAPTYPKWEPSDVDYPVVGRENDPLPDAVAYGPTNASSDFDAVESLMPKSLALGQIVPFEVVISVSGSTAPENGTIVIEPYWLTKTTNGADFGFDPDYGVIGAFVDFGDVGTTDPGGNATVSSLEWSVTNTGTNNEQIVGEVTITGLDDGDKVVVELWVVLKKDIPEKVNGNIQTGMGDAYTSDSALEVINTGNQTVPLLQAGDFFTEDADLSIIKSDSPDPVVVGSDLTYSITVTNNSPDTVANGILVTDTLDANVTFVSASDSGMHSAGIVTWPEFSLVPGESKVLTVNVTVDAEAPVNNFPGTSADGRGGITSPTAGSFDLLNKVEVSAITDDPEVSNNVYFEPTNVMIQENPSLNITKTADKSSFSQVGEVINYTFEVENTGNIPLTGVTVTDAKIGTLTGPILDTGEAGKLDVGETWTYTGSYTVTQEDIDAGSVYNIAYADSDQTDRDSDDETVPSSQGPALDITKTAAESDYDAVGDVIHYTIEVENIGNVTLTGVTVSDPLLTGTLSGPTGDIGQQGKLDVGEVWTYTGTYTINQADLEFGRVDNTATADSDQTGPDTDSETVLAVQTPALNITKTAAEANFDAVGDVIHYTITVDNTGNVALTGIVVSDPLLGTLTGPTGDANQNGKLDVDETWIYTGAYTVDQDDLDFGRIDNTATADSDQTGPDTDSETVPAVKNPALNITKTAAEKSFNAVGNIIHYTITVENTGNVTLTGVTVSDPLLGELTGPSGDGGQMGKLDDGETWTYTGTYTIKQIDLDNGKVDNTATADSDQTGPDTDSETVPAVKNPALNITKTAAEKSFNAVGNIIHYTITVENTGNVTLTGVTVSDPLLGELTGPTGDGGQMGKLDVGETWTYTGTYTVTQADLDAGKVDNTATADSDQTGPDTDSETVPAVQTPSMTIDKMVDENSFSKVGDVLHYTITVENIGNITLTGVTVVDATIGTLFGPTSNMNTDNLLEVGEIWTYTGTYTVDQDDIDFGRVDNTAYADSNETDRVSDSETVPSAQGPALNIIKTAADESFDAVGDVIDYVITVENVGNVTLTGVVVTDPLLGALTGPVSDTGQQGKLDVGETWTYNGSYTVKQVDLDAGKVDNTAYADSDQTGQDSDDATVPADQNPSLNIIKDAAETRFDAVGDVIHYTITVENTGNITLTGISVSDPLLGTLTGPTGDSDEDGKLDVDEIWSYTGSYTIKLADLDRGYVMNTAYADSDQTETDQDTETVPAEVNTGLTIDKKTNGLDNAGRILVGRTVTWTYKVTNTSNITLTNIVVRDNKFSEPIGTITSLAPGASETLSKSGTATLGDYTNEGTATFTPVEGTPIVARDTSSYTGYRERRDDPDPDPDYGDIRIFKFLDSDNDGEFDETSLTELPMNGMEFALYDANKVFIESLETGLNGTLTFRNLDFGTYYLREMNPGFTITSDNFGADGYSDPIRVNSTTTVVVEVGNRRNVATPEPIVDEVVEVIEEVPEAETPLALPDTGEIPPFFAYGFGSLLMLAGAYMKRRSR